MADVELVSDLALVAGQVAVAKDEARVGQSLRQASQRLLRHELCATFEFLAGGRGVGDAFKQQFFGIVIINDEVFLRFYFGKGR